MNNIENKEDVIRVNAKRLMKIREWKATPDNEIVDFVRDLIDFVYDCGELNGTKKYKDKL